MGDGVLEGRSIYPNEIFPPRIMLKQTHLIISRFSQPFLRPIYILTGRDVFPWRYLRSVPPFSGTDLVLFNCDHPDLNAAVPALDNKIGIPAFSRGNVLYLCPRYRVHQACPAFRTADRLSPFF